MTAESCTGDQRSEEDEIVSNDIEHSSAEQRVNSFMISEAGQIFRTAISRNSSFVFSMTNIVSSNST